MKKNHRKPTSWEERQQNFIIGMVFILLVLTASLVVLILNKVGVL